MKHRFSFIMTLWWVLILAMVGVLMLVYAPKEERISDVDNRMLAGVPEISGESILSAEYMQGVDSWLSDSFFAREKIVSFTKGLLARTAFVRYEKDVEAELDKENEEAEKRLQAMENAKTPETEKEEAEIPQEVIEQTREDTEVLQNEPEEESETEIIRGPAYLWLERKDGSHENLYTYSEKEIDTVSKMLNAYKDALGEDGTVHYMQIPYGSTARMWTANTDKYSGWGCNVEDALQSRVNNGIYIHNIPAILEGPMKNGEYMYFNLDHHWTARGASEAASAIMASQGYPTVDFEDYEYLVRKNVYGSHYDASDAEKMKMKADTLEVWYPRLPQTHYLVKKLTQMEEKELMDYERKNYRAYLFGTLGPWRLIDTGYSTGRTALIICDSFGTAFAPYLLPYYDNVLMTDLRPDYYDAKAAGGSVRDYIEKYGVDDIYMVLSTNSGVRKQYSLSYMMKYLD